MKAETRLPLVKIALTKSLVRTIFENQALRIESDSNNIIADSLHNFLAYIGQNYDTLSQFIGNK